MYVGKNGGYDAADRSTNHNSQTNRSIDCNDKQTDRQTNKQADSNSVSDEATTVN